MKHRGRKKSIEEVIKNIPQEKIVLRMVKSEVGEINETDVKLAESSKAIVLGFRVKKNPSILNLIDRLKIKVFTFDIIYYLIQGVCNFAEKILDPEILRIDIGTIKIKKLTFIKE